jgi:membrane fusion protein, copper/silver efflux system
MTSPKTTHASGPTEAARNAQRSASWRYWMKLMLPPVFLLLVGAGLIFLLGVAQRTGWIADGQSSAAPTAAASADVKHICPMFCVPPQEGPGRCAVCGMELVPASTGDQNGDGRSITIDPASRRVANIQTVAVRSVPQRRPIRAIGQLRYDEGALATISSYVDGRIERLYADFTGMQVSPGDQLALVYSPPLYSAQVELIQTWRSLNGVSSNAAVERVRESQQRLYEGSRRKLIDELGMTEAQVSQLEQSGEANSRLHLYSPINGTVIERLADEGQYVQRGEPIYRIADLSHVWLMLDLFPEDAAAIRYGQRVDAEVQSLPGRRFPGRVAFIDPVVNAKTRTVGVRVVLLNENRILRIGDFARANVLVDLEPTGEAADEIYDPELAGKWISPRHPHVIEDEPGDCRVCGVSLVSSSRFGFAEQPIEPAKVMIVPRSAVLMAGQNSVVYVEVEAGRFELRPVVLGPSLGDRIVIVSGVEPGEHVAVSGNFLIDSQMVLAGNPSLIDPTRGQEEAEPSEGPLALEPQPTQRITGPTGEDLERLYQAYFAIAATLADDQTVPADQAAALHDLADRMAVAEDLSDNAQSLIAVIAEHSAPLDEVTIEEARVLFKPISKSILQLAAQARGAEAETSFIHFYCSMVPGGEGDWLQPSEPLANPYWGSKMLRCGINAGQLSPSGITGNAAADPPCCEVTSEPEPAAGPSCCEAGSSTKESDKEADKEAESKPTAKPSCCDESTPTAPSEETES